MEEKQETKEIHLELRKVVDAIAHICLSCRQMTIAPIFGMFEKASGMLVNLVSGQEEPFMCKPCKKRIELMEIRKKRSLVSYIVKDMESHEIREFVRDVILPEIVEVMRKGDSITDALKQALGLGKES